MINKIFKFMEEPILYLDFDEDDLNEGYGCPIFCR